MNKKLTTIMLAVLLLLIGKVDAATLTQALGDNYIYVEVDSGQQITLNFNNNANYTFTKWTVESGDVTIDTTNPTITFTMPSSDVVIRGNYAEESAGEQQGTLLSDVATVGAYVTYVPSSTSYTVPTTVSGYASDQTYNPSSITSWRIFSKDGETIEIVSADSVGTLYLQGDIAYKNAVQTLNDMSAAYVNDLYATSGRSLGYYDGTRYTSTTNSGSAMIETELVNYKTISTTLSYGLSGFPYEDYQYMPDRTTLANHGSMYHSAGDIWIASRNATAVTSGPSHFCVNYMNISGGVNIKNLCNVGSSGTTYNHDASGCGVRPIVCLKSGLVVMGSGTVDNPYVITESNPSQYTVTYCANGGYGEMNPQTTIQGSNITLTANSYEHHSQGFVGWSTSATATTAAYTDGQTIIPTADMTLYAVWKPLIANTVKVGDYITYVPSSKSYIVPTSASGYDSDQTYKPVATISWRVFSNDGTNVEIISTDSVGKLYLQEATGYINAVQTLNDMSAAYVNSEYATSGRSLGYYDETRYISSTDSGSAMTETELENYKTIDISSYPLNYKVSGFPYDDYQYIPDKNVLANHGSMYHSSGEVWLASRHVSSVSPYYFYMGYMKTSGEFISYGLYGVNSDGSTRYTAKYGCGVRPIVALKSGIAITGGSGTKADPYIVNTPNLYTITYNANDGTGTITSQVVMEAQAAKLTTNAFARSGYRFLGWSTDATATTATYTDRQTITPTEDMTLYAVWTEAVICECVDCEEFVYTDGTLCYNCWGECGTCGECSCQVDICDSCGECSSCVDNFCYECYMCSDCTDICSNCGSCYCSWTVCTECYSACDNCSEICWDCYYCVDCCTCSQEQTYTLSYDANGGSGAPSSQSYTGTDSGTTFTISSTQPTAPSGKAFRGWAESSSATVAAYKAGASIEISSDTTLYAVYVTPLDAGSVIESLDVGAYVTYTPSSTSYTVSTDVSGYTSNQTFYPSSYKNWRVFSNDGTDVEIISDESVGDLYLQGATGYINVVQTLQDISAAYVNSTYAESARNVGYSESGLTDVANYKVINTGTYPLTYGKIPAGETGTFPYKDDQFFVNDHPQISSYGSLKQNDDDVWISSRYAFTANGYSYFYTQIMGTSGGRGNERAYVMSSSNSSSTFSGGHGVRPIVKLKSDAIVIMSGDGSPNNPYTLSY